MTFHPLSALFTNKKNFHWDDVDVRHFIQSWLRARLFSESVYCDTVHGGYIRVRVAEPILRQEALLSEIDLRTILKEEADFDLKKFSVFVQS